MATLREEPLTTGNISRRLAAVHTVLRSTALQRPTNSHFELELDMLRNIQPMELGVEQMCQAAVELVSSADYLSCCIQHTLKTISSVAFDDPASTVLQPSTRDETKACLCMQTQCQAKDEFFEPA